MALREELSAGRAGVRWLLPGSFEWVRDEARTSLANDPERRVTWLIRALPWPFDLRAVFDDVLRADVAADARDLFEEAFQPVEWPPGSGNNAAPRTADPTWSPVVEAERARVGDAPALRVVRRITYQPGNEILSGALVVPLAAGFVEIAALSRAGQTGYRESVLMMSRPGGLPVGPSASFATQVEYDDPAHDAQFADHPLTLVRAALRWLLDGGGLEVTAPAEEAPEGEVDVKAAGCAAILPPRYLPVPHALLPMSPTLASFARVGLADAPVRLLDIWRTPDRVMGRDRERQLRELAVDTVAAWAKEGATDIEQEAEVVATDGPRARVNVAVRFKAGGEPKVSAMCWRADADGTVLRVAASAAPYVPLPELSAEADAVMASLRRFDPTS